MKHQRPKAFIFRTKYDPGLPLTYFMARSNFTGFYMEKCDNAGFFGHYCILFPGIRLIL